MTHGQDGNRDQSPRHPSIKALPVPDTAGSQQPLRLNQNAERRRRHRAHRQQAKVDAIAHVARVNVSHETREANDDEGQSRRTSPLQIPQLQVTGGLQQLVKRNLNAESQQRRHADRQQIEETEKAICSADTERGA